MEKLLLKYHLHCCGRKCVGRKFNFKYSEKYFKSLKSFSSLGKRLSCPYVHIAGKFGMRGVFFAFVFRMSSFVLPFFSAG